MVSCWSGRDKGASEHPLQAVLRRSGPHAAATSTGCLEGLTLSSLNPRSCS
jgi:hypothetical protein